MSFVSVQADQQVIPNGQTETIATIEGLGSTADKLVGIFITDQPGNFTVEYSGNGTNWDYIETTAVVANTGVKVISEIVSPHVRLRFSNTGAAPTTFTRAEFRTSSAGSR